MSSVSGTRWQGRYLPSPSPQRQMYCPSQVSFDAESFVGDTRTAHREFIEEADSRDGLAYTPPSHHALGRGAGAKNPAGNGPGRLFAHRSDYDVIVPEEMLREYRRSHLERNGVLFLDPGTPLPAHIGAHVNAVRAADPAGRETLSEAAVEAVLYTLEDYSHSSCSHADFQQFMQESAFPSIAEAAYRFGHSAQLKRSDSSRMSPHLVPNDRSCVDVCIAQPRPNLTYGYPSSVNAGSQMVMQPARVLNESEEPLFAKANDVGMAFPFLTAQFKGGNAGNAGNDENGGDIWVAANQCAGAAACCVKAINRMNDMLDKANRADKKVEAISYAFAVDNSVAELYACWSENDVQFFVQRVDILLLSEAADFLTFRRLIRSILEWGKGSRLDRIKEGIDAIIQTL